MYLKTNNILVPASIDSTQELLDLGIYEICFNPDSGFYLEYQRDTFTFPEKMYDIDNKFIDRCINTFNKGKTNMGVLMNGFKGTGKTVNSKIIAQRANLPILLINQSFHNMNENMVSFISKINQDCVIILDEFEKNFKEDDSFILKLMDGLYNSEHKKLFILTTNRTRINENLINRPSRIRYSRNYSNLSIEVIKEVIDDLLIEERRNMIDEIITFISSLDLVTIDIMKIVIDEINNFGFKPQELLNYVNITQSKINAAYLTILKIGDGDEKFDDDSQIQEYSLKEDCRKILLDLKKKIDIPSNALFINSNSIEKIINEFNSNNKNYYVSLNEEELHTTIDKLPIGYDINDYYHYKSSEVDKNGIFIIESDVFCYAIVLAEIRDTIYPKSVL